MHRLVSGIFSASYCHSFQVSLPLSIHVLELTNSIDFQWVFAHHQAPYNLMDRIFHRLSYISVLSYLDDCLIFSSTFEQYLKDLTTVFQRFRVAGLKLGPKKCVFARRECVFWGHLISRDGIRPPPDRVKAVQDYPIPKSAKELQRFLGLLNWFRKFIPNFSAIAKPLHELLHKDVTFRWMPKHTQSVETLKHKLLQSSVLAFPRLTCLSFCLWILSPMVLDTCYTKFYHQMIPMK